jgi:hypothetical protein
VINNHFARTDDNLIPYPEGHNAFVIDFTDTGMKLSMTKEGGIPAQRSDMGKEKLEALRQLPGETVSGETPGAKSVRIIGKLRMC